MINIVKKEENDRKIEINHWYAGAYLYQPEQHINTHQFKFEMVDEKCKKISRRYLNPILMYIECIILTNNDFQHWSD